MANEVKVTDTPIEGFNDWIRDPGADLLVSLQAGILLPAIGDTEKRKDMVRHNMRAAFIAGAVWDQRFHQARQDVILESLLEMLPPEIAESLKSIKRTAEAPSGTEDICPDEIVLDK